MKTLILLGAVAAVTLGTTAVRDLPQHPASFGAPVSSTGAPGERTCATAGCHDTYAPNGSRGAMNITVAGAENGFEAGKTYDVTVRVAGKDSRRFGFQLVALTDGENANAGTFALADPARTQIMTNDLEFQDRKYATYTYAGTEQYAEGVGFWTVKWTAPAASKNVTFYAATVIANDDDTDYGDYVLTGTLPLAPASPAEVIGCEGPPLSELPFFTSDGFLHCTVYLNKNQVVSAELCDMTGRVYPLGTRNLGAGIQTPMFNVPNIAEGVYFVRLSSPEGSSSYPAIYGRSGK